MTVIYHLELRCIGVIENDNLSRVGKTSKVLKFDHGGNFHARITKCFPQPSNLWVSLVVTFSRLQLWYNAKLSFPIQDSVYLVTGSVYRY